MNLYKALNSKAAKKLIPLSCLFELTYRCNLNCVHCYIVKDKRKELQKKEIFRILKELANAGCLYLTFSGGEPFLRKDFFEIAEYARNLNFALRLFTNGTLINEKIADRVEDLKPLLVEISLYGFKDTHEEITKIKGSFDKTVRAIKLLIERKVNVLVKGMVMQQNVEEIWRLQEFVKEELHTDWRGIGGGLLISPCDDGNRKPLNYRLSDGQLKDYIKKMFRQFKSLGKDYKPRKVREGEYLCGAGLAACGITPFGEINPCIQIRLKNNNIKDRALLDIFREHKGMKRFRSLTMADKKDCRGCELMGHCFVCPGIALLEEGSLTAKLPEACRQAKIRKEIYETFHK